MAFWSNASLEPLRQYRWTVTFGAAAGFGLDNQVFALKKVQRPKLKVEEITHKYLNHSFYYPGRANWDAITMTFAAVPAGNEGAGNLSTSAALMKALIAAGYVMPTGPTNQNQKQTLAKAGFASGLGSSIQISSLNPAGAVTEGFTLHNPFFTSVEFGELDYGSEEIVEISTTVRYDYAKIITGNGTTPTDLDQVK